jgi:glycosyltransferase involved in cell wall biosynthesis
MAFLFDCYPRSWTSREDQHLSVCQALLRRGIQPLVVLSEVADDVRQIYQRAGVAIEVVNYGEGIIRYYRRLAKIFQQYHIQSVDIEFFSYFQAVPWLARLNGIKDIVFTESLSGAMRAGSWKAVLLRFRARLMTAPVKRFVASSDFIRVELIRRGLDASRISVVHKGIIPQRYVTNPANRTQLVGRYAIRPDEIILGSVTIMRPFKLPEVILQACSSLARRNVPFRLFMVGGGEMQAAMEDLSRRLGIADRVHWLGYVNCPKEEMRGWDVFLLASEGEAFGFVLLEAMSCGIPVVGAASGAIPEIVAHGRTGLLCPVRDAEQMALAIESLANDETRRTTMSIQAVARVQQSFTLDLAVRRTLGVYDAMWEIDRGANRTIVPAN